MIKISDNYRTALTYSHTMYGISCHAMPFVLKWNGNYHELLNENRYKLAYTRTEELISYLGFRYTGTSSACSVKNGVCTNAYMGPNKLDGSNRLIFSPNPDIENMRTVRYSASSNVNIEYRYNQGGNGFFDIQGCSVPYRYPYRRFTSSMTQNTIFVSKHTYFEFITNFAFTPVFVYGNYRDEFQDLTYKIGAVKNGISSSGKYIYSVHCNEGIPSDIGSGGESTFNFFPGIAIDGVTVDDFKNGTKSIELTNMTHIIEICKVAT